ncbi:MAG: Ig-like domain-containing protein [Actinomycetota bacterium]
MQRLGKLILSLTLVAAALVIVPGSAGALSGGINVTVPPAIDEGGSGTVTVTRTGDTSLAATADVEIGAPGTVAGQPDGIVELSWTAGDATSRTFDIDVADDNLFNGARTISVDTTTDGPDGAVPSSTSITVNDDEVAPGVSVSLPASIDEGGTESVTLTRTGATAAALTAEVVIDLPGTLVASGSVSWAAGVTTAQDVDFTVAQNTIDDDGRSVGVVVTTPGVGGVSGDSGPVPVNDDDAAPGVSVALPTDIDEGGTESITLTRTGATGAALTADVVVALPGVLVGSGAVSWAAGETNAEIVDFTVPQDSIDNDGREVDVTVTTPGAGGTSGDTGPVPVIDDDGAAGVSVSLPSDIDEGGTETITLTRTGATGAALTATVVVGSAGVLASSGTVNWTAGETGVKTVDFTVPQDTLDNDGRSVTVAVTTAPTGPVSGDAGPVPVIDDDSAPGVSVVTVPDSIVEGTTGNVILARTGATGGTVSATVSVTNSVGQVSGSQTVTWDPGETGQRSVTILATDNSTFDGDRTINISVAASGGAPVTGSNDRTITAVDDESRVSFQQATINRDEDDATAVVNVIREGSVGALTVVLEITDPAGGVPATEGEDYVQPSPSALSLEWASGQSGARSLTIDLIDTVADAGDERFEVHFDTVPSGVAVASPSRTRVNLNNVANTAPTGASDGPVTTAENTPVSVDVLGNDSDADGHALTLVAGSGSVSGGSFTCLAGSNGECTFTPSAGFVGLAIFTYEASDGLDTTGPTNVSVAVGNGDAACSTESGELGTSGADDIVGDDDEDEVLCGLGGNDSVAGGGGADLLRGGPGDDTLVIEGADTLDGGTGADVGILTLGGGRDEVDVRDGEIIVNGEVVGFDNLSELRIDLGGGNDSVVITPSADVAVDIVGGGGFDRLTYNSGGLTGVVESSNSIEADGVAPVSFTQLEVVETDDRRFIGTTGADEVRVTGISQDLLIDLLGSGDLLEVSFGALDGLLTVQDTGAGGVDELVAIDDDSSSEILVTSGSIIIDDERVNHDGIESIDVLGTGGDDTITVEAAGLAAAVSTPVVVVDGGTGTDTLIVEAGGLDASVDIGAGLVSIEGKAPISFTRVEFVQVRNSPTDIPVTATSGYWMLERNGVIHHFGAAADLPDAPVVGDAVDLVPTPDGQGVWVLDSQGGVYALGTAPFFGSAAGTGLDAGESYQAISPTPTGQGYWIFTSRGRVLVFGDAVNHGDLLALPLNGAIIDAVPTVSGGGYWMLGTDGGVFALGDAVFYGSTGDIVLNQPAVGLVPDPDGVGYWFVASDGGVFAFESDFLGSMGATPLNQPVNGMIPYGDGYLLVASDGGVFVFSNLPFVGSLGGNPPPNPIVGIAAPATP